MALLDKIEMLKCEYVVLQERDFKLKIAIQIYSAKLKRTENELEGIEVVRHDVDVMASSETDVSKIAVLKAKSAVMSHDSQSIKEMIDDLRCRLEKNAVMAEIVNESMLNVDAKIKIEQSKLDSFKASP